MIKNSSLPLLWIACTLCGVISSWAQSYEPYHFITLAGNATAARGSMDGTGSAAQFNFPYSVAVDGGGNVYVGDSLNHTIRKITAEGVVTTLAGSTGSFGSADGTGSAARFNYPHGVAVDNGGNVYVADRDSHTIRKVTSTGVVTTLAGLAGSHGTADGTVYDARFFYPHGVAVDVAGNVYVADTWNDAVRKITPEGLVTTVATGLNSPRGIAVDNNGNIYVASDHKSTIRKITPTGVVTSFAGVDGGGSADGPGSAAGFRSPQGVGVDSAGNVYVADSGNNAIRKITPTAEVSTLAGLAEGAGSDDGMGSAARFDNPTGVAVDSLGNLYVADSDTSIIRKVTSDGAVTTLAGLAPSFGSADGTGSAARFNTPQGVAVDAARNTYVAEYLNRTVRKVTPAGFVTTIAGLAGTYGSTDATGNAARFRGPNSVALDSTGNLLVTDYDASTLRKVTPAGVVTTLAGSPGNVGSADGTGAAAQFWGPAGIAIDSAGDAYVADLNNHTIRRMTPDNVVTTFAGLARNSGSDDGIGSAARFRSPTKVAIDSSGNFIVADGNHTIRKITPEGVVTTVAGLAHFSGYADGTGSAARFATPVGVAVDAAGNIYVADNRNHAVRKINSKGVVTTLAGLAGVSASADGIGSSARFNFPAGLCLDSAGNIYMADGSNHTIRVGAATTFGIWQKAFFNGQQLNDPAISGDLADPEADGLQTLLEYALNISPIDPSTMNRPYTLIDSNYLSLVYTKVVGVTDLTYTVEQSTNLVDWSVASPVNVTLVDNGITQLIKAQVPKPAAPNGLFLRLRVSR